MLTDVNATGLKKRHDYHVKRINFQFQSDETKSDRVLICTKRQLAQKTYLA